MAQLRRVLTRAMSKRRSVPLEFTYRLDKDPKYAKKLIYGARKRTKEIDDKLMLEDASGWKWIKEMQKNRETTWRAQTGPQEGDAHGHLRDPALQTVAIDGDKPLIEEMLSLVESRLTQLRDLMPGGGRPNMDKGRHQTSPVRLPKRLEDRGADTLARQFMKSRSELPIYAAKDEILSHLKNGQVVIVSGDTGCGKTTQVPQYILDNAIEEALAKKEHFVPGTFIVCTQPRRISTVAVANRVAEERLERTGPTVGWRIRHESSADPGCSLEFCTTGILLRRLRYDPSLTGIKYLIIDEVHERSVESDVLLTHVRELLKTRGDLRVVLMSATLHGDKLRKYFGNCPQVNVSGRTFPVEELFVEDMLAQGILPPSSLAPPQAETQSDRREDKQKYVDFASKLLLQSRKLPQQTADLLANFQEAEDVTGLVKATVQHIQENFPCKGDEPGAILVFLPGWEQQKRCSNSLRTYFRDDELQVHMLHSRLTTSSQARAFLRPPRGVRKVVLATNIAETSLTIDDVVYVLDAGVHNQMDYDFSTSLPSLRTEWIAKSNARQRAGRAGRAQPGICYRLYTRLRYEQFEDYMPPEIQKVSLESVVLSILAMGTKGCEKFLRSAPDPPDQGSVRRAVQLLRRLGAIERSNTVLTALGERLADIPLPPQLGKLCLYSAFLGCADMGVTVACCAGVGRDLFLASARDPEMQRMLRTQLAGESMSDFMVSLQLHRQWSEVRGNPRLERAWSRRCDADVSVLRTVDLMRRQVLQALSDHGLIGPEEGPSAGHKWQDERKLRMLAGIICGSLFPNMARADQEVVGSVARRGPVSTRHEYNVALSSASILRGGSKPLAQHWLVYMDKMQSKQQVRLSGLSMAIPHALAMFSDRLLLSDMADPKFTSTGEQKRGSSCLVVDDWLSFSVTRRSDALLLGRIRRALQTVADAYFQRGFCPAVAEMSTNMRTVMASLFDKVQPYSVSPTDVRATGRSESRTYRRRAERLDLDHPNVAAVMPAEGKKTEEVTRKFWREDLVD
mmetsp:Transcript_9086/g.27320  ORF Transcript_9086/g.27320 Transcript_9086/m.27320 type:complete len:1021 (-) Transcript_9086:700-3762(-)